jgi:hypothetical protein
LLAAVDLCGGGFQPTHHSCRWLFHGGGFQPPCKSCRLEANTTYLIAERWQMAGLTGKLDFNKWESAGELTPITINNETRATSEAKVIPYRFPQTSTIHQLPVIAHPPKVCDDLARRRFDDFVLGFAETA